MGAGEKAGAGSRERDPPWSPTLLAPTADGVSVARTGGGCRLRLAGRDGADGKGEGRDRRTAARNPKGLPDGRGKGETGKVRGRGGRSSLCGRQPRAQAGDRSARGAGAREREVHATVRGGRAAGGGARRGRRSGEPRRAGPAVERSEGSVLIDLRLSTKQILRSRARRALAQDDSAGRLR